MRYQVCDQQALCATSAATITVTPVNDPPVVVSPAATTANVGGVAVTIDWASGASDIDGDALTATASVTGAGTVAVDGGNLVYTPPATNPAQLTASIMYTVSDGNGGAANGSVTVTLNPLAPPPPPPPTATLTVRAFLGSGKTVAAAGTLVATTSCSDPITFSVAGQQVAITRGGVKVGNVCTSSQSTSAGSLTVVRNLRTGAWALAGTFPSAPPFASTIPVGMTVGDDTAATTVSLVHLCRIWILA